MSSLQARPLPIQLQHQQRKQHRSDYVLVSSGLASTVFYFGLRAVHRKRDRRGLFRHVLLQISKDMVENPRVRKSA